MKALLYKKSDGSVMAIADKEGIGYDGLRQRIDSDATDIHETFVDNIPTNPKFEDGVYVSDNDVIIRRKKDEANAIRERLLREDITYRDSPFQCDDASVRNMTTKLLGINNGDIFYWRDSNNNDHSFSDGDLESMLNMISTRGSQVYQASWLVKAEIEASPNPQDINVEALYGVHYNA